MQLGTSGQQLPASGVAVVTARPKGILKSGTEPKVPYLLPSTLEFFSILLLISLYTRDCPPFAAWSCNLSRRTSV
ncbi:unnamed protein product [Clonostachys byssicola]|uniref:Uncharacterized protein n=1 Tax=Clonostachys byssicola TaxID=160290 RepID=A0A9N9UER8_9HYPO|nr:unnamed protein product [Clonostachys byssicola]